LKAIISPLASERSHHAIGQTDGQLDFSASVAPKEKH
jgi:hypothetical protein